MFIVVGVVVPLILIIIIIIIIAEIGYLYYRRHKSPFKKQ